MIIPRKAPKEVIEHRITFGDYERQRLDELQDSIAFKNYASPLQSNVLSIALAGAAGYFGLAYIMDWWPFEKDGYDPWDKPAFNRLKDMKEAADNGQLAAYVTMNYNEVILPRHYSRVNDAQTWLNENPEPKGWVQITQAKGKRLIVLTADARLEQLEREYNQRLEVAMRSDAKWAEEQANNQNQ